MRPFATTISLDEARKRLTAAVRPIARTERVALDRAAGRVAATDVSSSIDVPPFSRSAMDGYAVIAHDTVGANRSQPVTLRIIDRIYTGRPSSIVVSRGTCTEIATGAPLPNGADAVIMVEETAPGSTEEVQLLAAATPGQNIGRRGADIGRNDRVISCGDLLTASKVGALAAVGDPDIVVFARPRVAILSTGNEVVDPGTTLAVGQIFDVNRFTLASVVDLNGGVADARKPVQDSVEDLTRALDECSDADLIVFSGGSSVGERDLIVDAIAARGEMVFHGIAVRPGKPTAFATVGSTPFFGMPGNPTSCLSNAYILLIPFLRALARLPPLRPQTIHVPLGRRVISAVGRHQFYTVRVRDGVAYPAFKGSGDITSLSQADGYIEIAADQDTVEEGTLVSVTLF
ncbi:MAG TPA: gephyrin-like molybdotransferase Glp [Vicinamibacterales bacterium]|nr:gephyrin-like molybdotransferase Glp [Vicinamibacterales bacterium]